MSRSPPVAGTVSRPAASVRTVPSQATAKRPVGSRVGRQSGTVSDVLTPLAGSIATVRAVTSVVADAPSFGRLAMMRSPCQDEKTVRWSLVRGRAASSPTRHT